MHLRNVNNSANIHMVQSPQNRSTSIWGYRLDPQNKYKRIHTQAVATQGFMLEE
jgi:hypothetical protein